MGIYKNVMELLVEEEVVRQFNALSERMTSYVNQVEWVAHALNQLPPLYATSEKGLHHQLQRGKQQYGKDIQQAVQRALAAVCRDPLRSSIPLQSAQEPAREILFQLRFLLRNDKLDWQTIPRAVELALEQASHDKVRQSSQPLRPPLYSPGRGASPFANYTAIDQRSEVRRRNLSQSSQSGAAQKPAKQPNEIFGWDDPLYTSH